MLFGHELTVSVQERLGTDAPSTYRSALATSFRDTSFFWGLWNLLAVCKALASVRLKLACVLGEQERSN